MTNISKSKVQKKKPLTNKEKRQIPSLKTEPKIKAENSQKPNYS